MEPASNMSLIETNRIRAELGLRPLRPRVEPKPTPKCDVTIPEEERPKIHREEFDIEGLGADIRRGQSVTFVMEDMSIVDANGQMVEGSAKLCRSVSRPVKERSTDDYIVEDHEKVGSGGDALGQAFAAVTIADSEFNRRDNSIAELVARVKGAKDEKVTRKGIIMKDISTIPAEENDITKVEESSVKREIPAIVKVKNEKVDKGTWGGSEGKIEVRDGGSAERVGLAGVFADLKSKGDLRPTGQDNRLRFDVAGQSKVISRRDVNGVDLTAKEAFNELSYQFHGKRPGLNKQERVLKRRMDQS